MKTSNNSTVITLAVCGTFLVTASLTALTLLVETGHDSSAVHFASLLGTGILNIAAVFGVGLRLKSAADKVADKVAVKAAATEEKVDAVVATTADTHEQVTNGLIEDKLDAWLTKRGLTITKSE
jgi:hypothetical protein